MADTQPKIGTKVAMEWRDSKTAEVGGTERIRKLNRLLHSFRPSLDLHRTRCFTRVYKEMEGCSEKRKMYFATAETFASLPVQIYEYAKAPYDDWNAKAWGAALVLVAMILVLSIAARYATKGRIGMVIGR